MATPVVSVLDLHGLLAKDASSAHPTPPPAYSPRPRVETSSSPSSSSSSLMPRTGPPCHHPLLIDRSSLPSAADINTTGYNTQHVLDAAAAEDGISSDDYPPQSSICLRINTSVRVSSNNNHVCLNETPAEHANAIARAVVHAVQQNSSGQCGIPMIDEDGRPRPVRIEVDAGLEVHGQGNVVGNEKFVVEILRQQQQQQQQKQHHQMLRRRRHDEDDIPPTSFAKRRRSE
ncbi:hypothetical protein E4U54_000903 [Claviceps lovelessii]|nr:hypothetical protein E4U54_000903 [Claviceps lovelessii]